MEKNEVIFLDETLLIGKGGHRDVYIHPSNPAQCIKINARAAFDHIREMKYRKSRELRHLPASSLMVEYYGAVATNLGTGYVFERAVDYDGITSKTIDELIRSERKAREENKTVKEILGISKEIPPVMEILVKFREVLFKENIIIPDMGAYNYTVQFDSPTEWRVRIIDDLGTAAKIPLVYYVDFLGASHVKRRWAKFIQWIQRHYPNFLSGEERLKLITF